MFPDVSTSTYQIYRIEEKINQTTTVHKRICNSTAEVRDISKILCKRGIFPLSHNTLYFVSCCLDFSVKTGTSFSFQDNRLFEISDIEITRVDCIAHK